MRKINFFTCLVMSLMCIGLYFLQKENVFLIYGVIYNVGSLIIGAMANENSDI